MNTTISPLRRFTATVALAGFAALGSVALAPAASAAPATPDGRVTVLEIIERTDKKGGPDAFLVFENGRAPVFFCDDEKPNKQKDKCVSVVVDGPRF